MRIEENLLPKIGDIVALSDFYYDDVGAFYLVLVKEFGSWYKSMNLKTGEIHTFEFTYLDRIVG